LEAQIEQYKAKVAALEQEKANAVLREKEHARRLSLITERIEMCYEKMLNRSRTVANHAKDVVQAEREIYNRIEETMDPEIQKSIFNAIPKRESRSASWFNVLQCAKKMSSVSASDMAADLMTLTVVEDDDDDCTPSASKHPRVV
jgi:hypothetical protein